MSPTSLDGVGFAPAEGNTPWQASFTSRSSDPASDASDQGTSFRQVMNSYSQAQQESEAENRGPNPTNEARSLPGTADLHDQEQETQDTSADQNAPVGAEAELGVPEADASSVGSSPAAALSAMQLLLQGGSLAQIVGGANLSGNPAGMAGDSAKVVPGNLHATQQALPGSATDKSKNSRDVKGSGTAERAASRLHLVEVNNMLLAPGQGTSPSTESSPGDSAKAGARGIALSAASAAEVLRAAGAERNGRAAMPAATNFAFAVRLTSEGTQAPPESHAGASPAGEHSSPIPDLQHAIAAGVGGATEAALAEESNGGEHHQEEANGAALMFGAEQAQAGRPEPSDNNTAPEQAAAPAPEQAAAAPGEPVRNVRLQLTGENNQRVDIRLVDVGGEMRVSVRAGDTKLAQTLQDHLPNLGERLNTERVRAEIWSPRSEIDSPPSSNNPNPSGQSSRGGGNSPGQDGQRRQGNGQQQNQPEWVDDLENYSSPAQTSRSNQIWPL